MAEQFGKYEILREIGAGGMANVFLVRSVGAAGVEKHLVIKRILPSFSSSPKFTAMFIDEARIAVTLNHPNIVQVYDFGRVDGHYYLAMELVDGMDLSSLLKSALASGRKPAFGLSSYVILELLKGLDYAHRKRDADGEELGIVHRDVSPQNVLISSEGAVKLTDFGIARARVAAPEEEGVVKGKFSYMAPEQGRGDPVDARSDIYCAGILLWEFICGRPLLAVRETESGKAGLKAVVSSDVPPPSAFEPEVPDDLERICMRALERGRDQRYGSAREMVGELTRHLYSSGEVHDAFTLTELIDDVRQAAPPPPGDADASRRLTMPTARVPELADIPVAGGAEVTVPERPKSLESEGRDRARRTVSERKEVVCICGELTGFTELHRQTSGDRFRTVLMDYLAMLEGIAFKAEAVTQRVSEGGFTMIVGLPLSRETDGERAMALALDIIEATEGMNRNLEAPLSVTLGIYRGSCTVNRTEGRLEFEHELDAAVEERAHRLAREAQPGEILVGGGAYRLARQAFAFEEVDALEVQDVEGVTRVAGGRLRVHSLVGPKAREERAADARAARGRLQGRDVEVRALRDAYARTALQGRGQAVAVVGEAGVGKTAVVDDFLGGQAAEAMILRAEPMRLDPPPYSLIIDLLGSFLDIGAKDSGRETKRKLERALAPLLTKLRDIEASYVLHSLGALLQVKHSDSLIEGLDPEARQARTFMSLRRLLELLAAERPLLVACDSLERADQTSRDFLRELVIEGVPARVLLLLSGRPGEAMAPLLALSAATPLEIAELSEGARRKLVREWLGPRQDAAEITKAVTARGGGNPLFLREILETLAEGDLLDRAGHGETELPIPTSIEGLMGARLDSVPEADRSLLVRAAQVERPLTAELLAALLPDLDGPLQALGRLADLGLLVPVGAGGAWRFRHPVLREFAAGALETEAALAVHNRAADWLLERQAEGGGVDDGEIARHLQAAGRGAEAAVHWFQLGFFAFEAGSMKQAIPVLQRTAELLPAGGPELVAATGLLERAFGRSGITEGRRAVVEGYRDAAIAAGDHDATCDAYNRLARVHLDLLESEEARGVLQEGLELSRRHGIRRSEGKAMAYLGYAARNEGDYGAAEQHCRDALAIFEQEEEWEDLAATWTILGIILRQTGRASEAVTCYQRSLDAQSQGRNETVREATYNNLSLAENALGNHHAALLWAKRALKLNRDIGNRRRSGLILNNLGDAYLELGRPGRAFPCIRRAVQLGRARRNPLHEGVALVSLARTELERGELVAAAAAVTYAAAVSGDTVSTYLDVDVGLVRTRLALESGNAREALSHALATAETASAAGMAVARAVALARAARAHKALGEVEAAIKLADEAVAELPEGAPPALVEVCHARWEADGATGAESIGRARRNLAARAASVPDAALRQSFLERPLHRLVLAEAS
jgi:serine/threonine protein kinase/tetratricopeptide (TPR) repeat protein